MQRLQLKANRILKWPHINPIPIPPLQILKAWSYVYPAPINSTPMCRHTLKSNIKKDIKTDIRPYDTWCLPRHWCRLCWHFSKKQYFRKALGSFSKIICGASKQKISKNHFRSTSFQVSSWPSSSLDLCPTEHRWDVMDKKSLIHVSPTSKTLKDLLLKCCRKKLLNTFGGLV